MSVRSFLVEIGTEISSARDLDLVSILPHGVQLDVSHNESDLSEKDKHLFPSGEKAP